MNVITTDHLSLRTAQKDDLIQLNRIFEQVLEYFKFDPSHVSVSPETCLTEGDLPPRGVKEKYEIYAIWDCCKIVGYVDFYKGFPNRNIAYISLLFIDQNVRECGYGREVVGALCKYFNDSKYSEVRLAVSLKNWSGLKFWHKMGFDTISMVAAEDTFSAEGYGCLQLKKDLVGLISEN